MSYARILSAQPYLLDGALITIEVDLSRGLYMFSVVGLPDKAVEEARDRVSSALKNSGFESPKSKNQKVVISLSPADIKKEGSYFDLGIAIGYLLASEAISFDPKDTLFLGELTLSGDILPLRGILALIETAKKHGITQVFVPLANAPEAALVDDITVFGVRTLKEVVTHIQTTNPEEKIKAQPKTQYEEMAHQHTNMRDIRGQETAKRGLEIAAAGGHNIAMSGPPGTGKTMLARAFASILPELSREDMLEITRIHSIAGTLGDAYIQTTPPFRAPHHTASYVSIIGGGTFPKPGEVTLAHRGVLFLDEFPEFEKRVIESLRQPLEDNVVSISRAKGTALFPSNFTLVAAMNPCPCGYLGSRQKTCSCGPGDIARYRRKLSGPIVDRIDLWVTVDAIEYEKLTGEDPFAETSETIRARVLRARERARHRFRVHDRLIRSNSDMHARDIANLIPLSEEVKNILNQSAKKLELSGRAYHRVIKLARTIADLDDKDFIEVPHILEALQYRPKILL